MSDTPGMKYHDPATGEPLTFEQVKTQIAETLQRLVENGFLEEFKVDAAGNVQMKLTDAAAETARQTGRDGILGLDAEFGVMMADYRDGLLP